MGRAVSVEIPESLLTELGGQQYSVSLNRMLSQGMMTYEMVQQLATPELVKQFVSSRRQELVEMQSALMGFEDIAVKEGLRPTEGEIEVSGGGGREGEEGGGQLAAAATAATAGGHGMVCKQVAATRCHPPTSARRTPRPIPCVQVEFKEAVDQFGQYKQEYNAERLRDQVFETVQVRRQQ